MRELKHMNKSLNTVTRVSQRGFDQPARETADQRTKTKTMDRSSAYKLTTARSRTDTAVVAAICSQTQQGEETNTERWWPDLLDTGYLVPRSRN